MHTLIVLTGLLSCAHAAGANGAAAAPPIPTTQASASRAALTQAPDGDHFAPDASLPLRPVTHQSGSGLSRAQDPDADASFAADVSRSVERAPEDVAGRSEQNNVLSAAGQTAAVVTLGGVAASALSAVLVVAIVSVFSFGASRPGKGRMVAAKTILTPLFLLFASVPLVSSTAPLVGSTMLLADITTNQAALIALGGAPGVIISAASGAAIGVGGLWMIFGPQKDYLTGLDILGLGVFAAGVAAAPVGLTVMGGGAILGSALAYAPEPSTSRLGEFQAVE